MRWNLGLTAPVLALVTALLGCGSRGHPYPAGLLEPEHAPSPQRVLPESYRLHVGDQLTILVLEQADLGGSVKVRPDGKISAPGAGELDAAGKTVAELTEELRTQLRRLLRHPDVSVMLSNYAEQQIYVFGEVKRPGALPYVPAMTTLHAVGEAAGPTKGAKMSTVMLLRRTGPSEMDVYRIDLEAALDGKLQVRDFFLQPYDVIYVPRSLIAEINLFVDQFVRQNMAPITAYIEGWRAFHIRQWRSFALD